MESEKSGQPTFQHNCSCFGILNQQAACIRVGHSIKFKILAIDLGCQKQRWALVTIFATLRPCDHLLHCRNFLKTLSCRHCRIPTWQTKEEGMSEESTLGSGLTELVAIFRRHGKGDEGSELWREGS